MFVIDDELQEFVESGVAVLVGAVDAEGKPHLAYAWGPRVHPGRSRISIYIDGPRAAPLLGGRESNPQFAATFTDPVSVRSIQLKGRVVEVAEPNESEQAWVNRHRDAMTASTALIGDSPQVIRNLWMQEATVRVDFTVERAFDQTPGPNAGQPL